MFLPCYSYENMSDFTFKNIVSFVYFFLCFRRLLPVGVCVHVLEEAAA